MELGNADDLAHSVIFSLCGAKCEKMKP